MKTSAFFLFSVCSSICLLIFSPIAAATWYVDAEVALSGDGSSWETAFKAIQEGIDAAADGDTVIVAQGTYVENIHFKGKNIVLTSTDPLDPHVVAKIVLDGNAAGSVVTFEGTEDETCVLSGFTIRNGQADDGGGIYGGPHGNPTHATIQNNVITGNTADSNGGGAFRCDGTIQNNRIFENLAQWGAGGGLSLCGGTIQNNTISGNSAQGGCGGGLCECDGTIQNNTIAGNSAQGDAGGLYRCHGTVQNNMITGNSAQWGGGGGLCECDGTLQNNTITGNCAGAHGGGLYQCEAVIRNCIIWGNSAAQGGDQVFSATNPTYSCIQDWAADGDGIVTDDPGHVDPAQGDYHLRADSPCIDAGISFYWFAWPQRDLDGNCRLHGFRVDMGCYEYGSSPDSDGDLLADSEESARGTDPLIEDTDGDGLRDGLELLRRSDPLDLTPPSVVHVPLEAATIQETLCVAVTGDEIVVAPGVYRENLFFCGLDILLRGSDPEDSAIVALTILDGNGTGRVVSFTGFESEPCVLSGFTIRNGKAMHGGAISGGHSDRRTRATIRSNVIAGNSASRHGGGLIWCNGIIQGNTLTANFAKYDGGALYECNGTIQNNFVTGNSSERTGGGLAYCDGTVQNNTITGNSAGERGGGLGYCRATVGNNSITGNSAVYQGGGLVWCGGTIQNNTITGNRADLHGGGLYECDGMIQNNIIAGNSAADLGGGLTGCGGNIQNNVIAGNRATRGGGLDLCHGTIENNTIAGNSARQGGGALHWCRGTIRNCILWGNTAWGQPQWQIDDSSQPTYCCIQNWSGEGEGNLSADPQFLDPGGADHNPRTCEDNDYRLLPDSRCIDAGQNQSWMWEATDPDVKPRILLGRSSMTVDIGAYEYGSFHFRLFGALTDSGTAELIWNSRPGDTYAVWSCVDLLTNAWIGEGTVSSQGTLTSWIDTDLPGHMRFYRIELK